MPVMNRIRCIPAGILAALAFVSVACAPAGAAIINVQNFGAIGNGTTNDTSAIQNAIAALLRGDTLLFPCGTYVTSSQITIAGPSNITIDGSSCATIKNTAGSYIGFMIGPTSGVPNYGSAVALSAAPTNWRLPL